MRFNKKLLTVLLPITATSTLVPVLTSCNKGSSWDFEYGSLVNCWNTSPSATEASYHSLADVKSAVKNHISVESKTKVTSVSELPQWDTTSPSALNNQLLYFDFIASMSIIGNKQFNLIQWSVPQTLTDNSVKFEVSLGTGKIQQNVYGTHIAYLPDSSNPTQINIAVYQNAASGSGCAQYKSYMFQNTKIGA